MSNRSPHVFVSYARQDYPTVALFVSALRARGLDVWTDVDSLKPGEVWETSIRDALTKADALLVFVSRHSMASEWVKREVEAMIERREIPVVPVILEEVQDLPKALQERQWIMLTNATPAEMEGAADTLARQLLAQAGPPQKRTFDARLQAVTSWVLDKARGLPYAASQPADSLLDQIAQAGRIGASGSGERKIFVVHGHDKEFCDEVVMYLESSE